ncbi:response regulator [Flavitalea sp. BT771]|uniref:response regulator n=1 Tax=Flavitalea sp. BT771 TaxID=3063329 RepID=UPI0026E38A12|nr:response regulator [Flavitalea sp. BT771]MDO6433690.1 response regulator [Flavitalea sp. BT771]MDV6222405.1 response regulator [Flavitalea sp. BT771]
MRPINILLADDDPLDIIDISRQLDKQHIIYQLYEAHNGEEAIGILEEAPEPPDIALIDINMPKMNGLELLQTIRQHERWKHLKCFIITTSDEKIDRRTASALGVSGYIIKPLKLNSPASMDAFNLMIDLINLKSME